MERLKLGIEVGQVARVKKIVTEDNLTHDWEVSVRGADKNNIRLVSFWLYLDF